MKNNNNTFIKVGKLIINLSEISAVYPHDVRGYIILIHGREFRVSEDEGRAIIDRILDNDTPETFDPDRRINTSTSVTTGLSATKINKIRVIVNSFNSGHSYTQFTMTIEENGNIKIYKDREIASFLMISSEGVMLEDTISNTFNEFKSEIIDVLAE